jgi:putative two-component system response regulator
MHHDPLRNMRILIVDSLSIDVLLLQDILSSDGYEHHKGCTDAALTLTLLSDFAPDLVVIGMMEPQHEALTLLRQVRDAIGKSDFLPVLVLTACNDSHLKRRALAAGATDFLAKPLDHTEVLLRIRNLLHARRMYLQLAQQGHNANADKASSADADISQHEVVLHSA